MKNSAEKFMKEALREAYSGIRNHEGGPFGSVIVKDGEIVGRGHNRVIKNQDPTCHGEMEAIRNACENLGTFDLSGCEIYTTAQPCPMCLGAIMWANMEKVYYGCNCKDTEKIGFRDDKFYDYFAGKNNVLETEEICREDCLELFEEYEHSEGENY